MKIAHWLLFFIVGIISNIVTIILGLLFLNNRFRTGYQKATKAQASSSSEKISEPTAAVQFDPEVERENLKKLTD